MAIKGACEHTQGYNSSPIAIIFGIQLVWVLIKVGIVNEPYPARENGSTGLRKLPISPFIGIFVLTRELLSWLRALHL